MRGSKVEQSAQRQESELRTLAVTRQTKGKKAGKIRPGKCKIRQGGRR